MVDPYIGEIRMFGFGRAPSGWLACDGSMVPISTYETLYSLLGTSFGGDGQSTFGVPDMRGRIPVHKGQGQGLSPYVVGQKTGDESVSLTVPQMGQHTHIVQASNVAGTVTTPGATTVLAGLTPDQMYQADGSGQPSVSLMPAAVTTVGGGQPHDNLAPTLAVSFCIAYEGIFPSQG